MSYGPLPIYQYLDYDFDNNKVDTNKLTDLINLRAFKENRAKALIIDYKGVVKEKINGIRTVSVDQAISEIIDFYLDRKKL
jgi:hypothetical protein